MKNPFTQEAALIQEIDDLELRITDALGKLDFKKVKKLEKSKSEIRKKLAEERTGVLL